MTFAKLILPSGIPSTLQDLLDFVQETFHMPGMFSLMYEDMDFGGQFFTWSSIQPKSLTLISILIFYRQITHVASKLWIDTFEFSIKALTTIGIYPQYQSKIPGNFWPV